MQLALQVGHVMLKPQPCIGPVASQKMLLYKSGKVKRGSIVAKRMYGLGSYSVGAHAVSCNTRWIAEVKFVHGMHAWSSDPHQGAAHAISTPGCRCKYDRPGLAFLFVMPPD